MTKAANTPEHIAFSALTSIILTYISISLIVIALITVELILKPDDWVDLLLIPIWLLNLISACSFLFKNHIVSLIKKIPINNFIIFYILVFLTIFIDWRFFTMFFDMPYYSVFAPQYIDKTINAVYTVLASSIIIFLLLRHFNIQGMILPYYKKGALVKIEVIFTSLLLLAFFLLSAVLIFHDLIALDSGNSLLT